MSESQSVNKPTRSSGLVIVARPSFLALEANPIDAIGEEGYARIERLVSWFVLRAPLTDETRLANPGSIGMFSSDVSPERGSRTVNRGRFEESFLVPLGLDCTAFEFVYRRSQMRPALLDVGLGSNGPEVFDSVEERGAVFVGRGRSSREDSCAESVFRHVRNAFAHGRLAAKDIGGELFLFLEDGCDPRNVEYDTPRPDRPLEVRARLLLRVSTLEEWHTVLERV